MKTFRVGGARHQLAHDRLDRRECERALQVIEAQPVAHVPQVIGRDRRSAPLRGHAAARRREAHCRHRALRGIEQVQPEIRGELAADGDAANAVALGVEARRKHSDADASGLDGEDAAANAAFRRQSGPVEPFAGKVVHAAGRHHREDVVHVVFGDRADPGDRIHAAVGERRADHREIAAGDADGALAEIGLERRCRLVVEDREIAQHPADRAIAMPGRALGGVDLLVDVERAAGIAGEGVEDARSLLLDRAAGDQAARRDCTSIDQRIERRTRLGLQADRVECVARGLDADFREHGVLAVLLQREPVGQRLGDGLDRERLAGIADFVDESVMRGDADAEPVGVGARELRDVVGDVSVRKVPKTGVQ